MKEKNILWVDQDHPETWDAHFVALEEAYGFKVEVITLIDDSNVLNSCQGKNAIVIHCGTQRPMAGIKNLLQNIKTKYPNIKIGLETNAIHPDLENLTDFYVDKPILVEDLEITLRENLE